MCSENDCNFLSDLSSAQKIILENSENITIKAGDGLNRDVFG
jgi:hypothetical protein